MDNSGEKNKERAKQEALATLGMYALERNNLESIFDRAIDISCIIMHLDCAVIFTLHDKGTTLAIGAQAGCAEDCEPISIDEENFDINYALKQDAPTVVENYSKEKRFNISPFLEHGGIESSIHIVIRGTDDTFGVIGFYAREYRAFEKSEENFLQILANMIGMAIERDQINKELREKNDELRDEVNRSHQLQQEILNNNILQRWELGSYLHDHIAQILASATVNIYAIEKNMIKPNERVSNELKELETKINDASTGIRDLTQDIIPIDIEEEGFAHALNMLMEKTKNIHGIDCSMTIDANPPDIIDIKLATNLYFIIQEAVKNACIHGNATNVHVSFIREKENLKLVIKDDGVGLKPSEKEENGRGLRIMSHRMELLGGTFDISRNMDGEQSGTKIICSIPLNSFEDNQNVVKW